MSRMRIPVRKPLAAVLAGMVALGTFAVAVATDSFPDVLPDTFYHDDVTWLKNNGISTGYTDGTYRPGQPLTRGEAATMLHRAAMAEDSVMRGAIGLDLQVAAGQTGDYGVEANLTEIPPVPVDDPNIFVQTGTWMSVDATQGPIPALDPDQAAKGDANTTCPVPADPDENGWWDQVDELTAAAGDVCIYIMESDHADNFIGFGRGYGFKLLWDRVDDNTGSADPNDNPEDMFVTGVWVYMAP